MTPLISPHYITLRAVLFYICVGVCIVAFVLYVLFQARFILAGPQITLTTHPQSTQTERIVVLEGSAQNIVRMTLNGRQIYTDTNGNFREALILENGYTIATLQAEDRYGRSRSLTRQFVHVGKGEDVANTESAEVIN